MHLINKLVLFYVAHSARNFSRRQSCIINLISILLDRIKSGAVNDKSKLAILIIINFILGIEIGMPIR